MYIDQFRYLFGKGYICTDERKEVLGAGLSELKNFEQDKPVSSCGNLPPAGQPHVGVDSRLSSQKLTSIRVEATLAFWFMLCVS